VCKRLGASGGRSALLFEVRTFPPPAPSRPTPNRTILFFSFFFAAKPQKSPPPFFLAAVGGNILKRNSPQKVEFCGLIDY